MKIRIFCASLLVALFGQLAFAQTYALAPIPKLNYLSNAGLILPGAKLCTYAAGSTTPRTTYADFAGTPNTNPVTLDSYGRANVWINSNSYKFVLYNSGTGNTCNGQNVGALIWSVDNISVPGLGAGTVTGTGMAGRCAQWTSTTNLTYTSAACGSGGGGLSGTVGTLVKFTSTNTGGNSNVTEDTAGTDVLKVNERLLVNNTASDVTLGAMVTIGGTSVANSSANAQVLYVTANGGGSGRTTLTSTATGTAYPSGLKAMTFETGDGGGFGVGNEVLRLTTDPFVQFTTSYTGGTLSDSGAVALRNNAGTLEKSENGGAWTPIAGSGGGTVTSVSAGSGMNFTTITSSGPVTCATADSSTFGCVTAADFAQFGSYDLVFSLQGLPPDGVTYPVMVAVRDFTLASNFSGSRCQVTVNPTATAVYTVNLNGSSAGTVSISTMGVCTFATSGAVAVVAGDYITIDTPTPQDVTLADVMLTFKGTKN